MTPSIAVQSKDDAAEFSYESGASATTWAAKRCEQGSGSRAVSPSSQGKPKLLSEPEVRPTASNQGFGIKGLFKRISRLGRKNPSAEELPQLRRIVTTRDFGRLYELGEELMEPSRNGTEVRHAKRRKDGTPVVVKVRRKGKYGEEGCAFASAQDEAEWRTSTEIVLNLSKHPHLATLQEALEDGGAYYLVMERAHGTDLFEVSRRQRGPQLTISDIRETMRQVLEGLALLHSEGVLHRDLKLDNVVLDRSRRSRESQSQLRCGNFSVSAKIVDFDDAQTWPLPADFSTQGKPRCIVGTDQYIAPEAYSGEWSPASDIFSAGVMLFRLLNGRFPFDPRLFDDAPGENYVGCKKMEEIRQRLEGSIIDFFRRARGAPEPDPQAISLCRRLVALDPNDRLSALDALADPWFCPDGQRSVTPAFPSSGVAAPPERVAAPPSEPGPLMPMTPNGQEASSHKALSEHKPGEVPPDHIPAEAAVAAAAQEPDGKRLAELLLGAAAESLQADEEDFTETSLATLPGCVLEEEESLQKKLSRDRLDSGSTFSGGTCGTRAGMVNSSRGSSFAG